MMWKAIKWGFGLLIGAMVAYALFWVVLILGAVMVMS